MYKFKGALVVRKFHSKYGEFAVGTIQTPIGEFSVKQQELDEFEEGIYQGRFVISSIQTVSGGFGTNKLILESRATLDTIQIDGVDEATVDIITEADPITEDVDVNLAQVENTDDLENLFNEQDIVAVKQGTTIKLDPTNNRENFRQQKNYLSSNGWKFNVQEQSWHSPQDL